MVRREVKSIVQQEVVNIVKKEVAAIVQQVISIEEPVTVQRQVFIILDKQLFSVQLSSPEPSCADIARTPPFRHPTNLRTISTQTTPSIMTSTSYYVVEFINVEKPDRRSA